MHLSTSGVYLAITGVLVLALVVWTVAFRIGKSRGQDMVLREWERADAIGSAAGRPTRDPIHDPDRDPINAGIIGADGAERSPPALIDNLLDPPVSSVSGSPAILAQTGPLDADPRTPGNNYLKLASSVGGDEAARIVRFLASRGVQAIAVRTRLVDPAPDGVNNPSQYDLYSLLPVPSDQYSSLATRRQQHERQVRSLGSQWQSQHRGTVNFARPQWEKYSGPG